ncbi:MAG: hypothetical protein J5864_10290, partial [Oscillospiraceae bacterium]|nr:hypothetical protein [Oscillospiraceae bacterium]
MKFIIIVAFAVLIIAAFILLRIYANKKYKRNRTIRLDNSFGAERRMDPELADRMKDVGILYDMEKEFVPAEKQVDEITWNDLNMDDVFAMVNHTESFAGEQSLYSRLHILCGNEKFFEKQ